MNFEYFSTLRVLRSVLCLLGIVILIGGIWYHRVGVSESVMIEDPQDLPDASSPHQDVSPLPPEPIDPDATGSVSTMAPPLDSQDALHESLMDLSKGE